MSEQLSFEEPHSTRHNVFFAIRPDALTVARIVQLAQDLNQSLALKAKPLAANRLHVSLYAVGGFNGSLPLTILNEAKNAAATITIPPFKIEFDHVVSFGGRKRNRALVLMGEEGVIGLAMFRQSLSETMMKAGIGRWRSQAFSLHLTIMYADRIDARVVEPISWIADELVLIDSLLGQTRHVLLGHWPLREH